MNTQHFDQIDPSPEIERRILHGLEWEYRNCLGYLGTEISSCLSPPQFSLFDARKRLGKWSFERKEIALSRSFVRNCCWGDIREVLMHEIAHQIADECFHAPFKGETSHGPSFHQACALLRIKPDARASFVPLSRMIFDDTETQNDPILRRIRKLLALADSHNRHEAEAAATKARELLAKHALAEIEGFPDRKFFSMLIGKPVLRRTRHQMFLAALLIRHYFVKGIWCSAFNPELGKPGTVLEISGSRTNLQIASYVYDFIERFIASEWERYTSKRRLGNHRRVDFACGILSGFEEKLKQQDEHCKTSNLPMILPKDQHLETYYRNRYPHIRHIHQRQIFFDATIHEDGKRLGKELVIHKGIQETTDGTRRFLE
ncbi:MAG: DUF2786 domain-containing protein [Thermodesulfobacteriota bacterium]